ncbi:MAG: C40 family peptidase [Mycobacteriales bacterium]
MSKHKHVRPSTSARLATVLGVSGALLAPVGLLTAAPAAAHIPLVAALPTSSPVGGILEVAASQAGKPYVYGANGPNAFDCSSYVQYVFRQVGREVPRTSGAQYAASQPVAQRDKQPGDLIAMRNSSGRITHVGIYAGDNAWWVNSSSRDSVIRQNLYSNNYSVGRFA